GQERQCRANANDIAEIRKKGGLHSRRKALLPGLAAFRKCKALKSSDPVFRSVDPLSRIVGIISDTSRSRLARRWTIRLRHARSEPPKSINKNRPFGLRTRAISRMQMSRAPSGRQCKTVVLSTASNVASENGSASALAIWKSISARAPLAFL